MENKTLLDRKLALPKLIGDTDRFLIISGLAGPCKRYRSPNTRKF